MVTASVPWFRRASPLVGQIDHMSHRIVRGWAWHPKRPKQRVRLEFFYREVFLGRVSAGMFRSDLLALGFGDGHHAFTFHLPDDVSDAGFDLADLCVASSGPERWTLPFAEEIAPAGSQARRLPSDHRQALGPFLEMLRDQGAPKARLATQAGRRARIDRLVSDVVELEVSEIVAHIAGKYARSDLVSHDAEAHWRWYLGTYAREFGPQLAPLSRADIERLTLTKSEARSYVSDLFLAPDATETAFEWAFEADRLFVADCLVRSQETSALRAIDAPRQAYPLSMFMRRAKVETAILRRLPSTTQRQRRRLYALFMILGLRNPSILTYLPTEWMLRLLEESTGLEAALSDLFGADLAIDRDRYIASVEASGYDLASQTFRGHRYDGHRVRGGAAIVTAPAPVDVQVFGPFRRKMGLGESCRRVAAALRTTSFSLNLVDYDVGTAATFLEQDETLGELRPARLNILHLNAEEIPEAIAYLPDVFSRTPTVAIPYWELNRLAQPHRLGVRAVDEIWAASRFLADVFAEDGRIVRWIGMSRAAAPFPTPEARAALRLHLRLAPGTFVFLTTSDALSWVQRKNPLAVIEAFRAAFATEDVALVVKTHNLAGPLSEAQVEHWGRIRALCAADGRIALVDESFDATTQHTLLAACDCLVSLHRAEGLGLDVIDALDLGTPVIATDYSGTRDLCTRETAWLVDLEMRGVDPSDYSFVEPGHLWAEPRPDAAIQAMRDVVANPSERDRRVRRGHDLVSTFATKERFAERLEEAVHATLRAHAEAGDRWNTPTGVSWRGRDSAP